MKKPIKFITGYSAFLALFCLLSLSSPVLHANASTLITMKGTVYDRRTGAPIPNAYVDVFTTKTGSGDGTPAFIEERKTASDGSYSVTTFSFNTTYRGKVGSWVTMRVYAANYVPYQFVPKAVFRNNGINTFNIRMSKVSSPNTIYSYGLRESYYGLTRPYFGKGFPSDFTWPTQQATTNIVNFMKDATCAQRPMHVVIVTQTDPSSFQDQNWGPTFCLWRKDSEKHKFPDSHNLYFENLKDRNGNQMSTSQIDIDAILTEYDNLDQDVYLQVESGYSSMDTLIPEILTRFYKGSNGVVKHPCVKGVGIDVEWYQNTDPTNDWTSMSETDGDHILALVKGFNPELRVYFKHYYGEPWDPNHPNSAIDPNNMKDVIYIDDSQGFENYELPDRIPSFNECKTEFSKWAAIYTPADVGFQIGYDTEMFEDPNNVPNPADRLPRDMRWWGSEHPGPTDPDTTMVNPITEIPSGILGTCANEPGRKYSFVWVDFSVRVPQINTNPATGLPFDGLEVCTPPPFGPWPPTD